MLIMLVIALPVFITGLIQTIRSHPALEADTSWDRESKILGEGNNSESSFWNDSAVLIGIHDRDTLCKGNADGVFPDTSSCSRYYRCRNEAAEFYKCINGFMFDFNERKCKEKEVAICHDGSKAADQCYKQENGVYPDRRSSCREYFRCEDGLTVESMSCPKGQAFSYHLQTCQLEGEVNCVEASCKVGFDDFFIHPGTKCQAYYYCKRGVRSDFRCSEGFTFSKEKKECVEGGLCYEPICTGRIDGEYPDTTHDCKRSFLCKGGLLQEIKTCPLGQKFNGKACLPEADTHCDKPGKTAIALYIQNDFCKDLPDGYNITPGTNCKNYRLCQKGKTVSILQCPEGEKFDGKHCSSKLGICSEKLTNSDFCFGLSNGFHADYFNGCRDYHYCLNHERVLTSSCLEGMVWNGKQCTEEKFFKCEAPRKLKECNGLTLGLYQDKSSGCAKYIYCKHGNGVVLSCQNNEIFDGEHCVPSDEYTCNPIDECHNQPDGYNFDENSSCRSYYYCSNGRKITYVCSDNFLFNGTECVRPETFTCPFSSNDCVGKQNGYHADKSTNCRKYFYCYNNDKITTITCNGKKIFDGHRCVLVGNPTEICAKAGYNPCRLKENGLHTDTKSNCRKYFYCENEMMKEEYTCPVGMKFNGTECDENFSCGGGVCGDGKVGFFPDLSSDCKKYYFCVGKRRTMLSCQEGKVFNGQICVNENSYKCPHS